MNWNLEDGEAINFQQPFMYELAYYCNISMLQPWNSIEETIPCLIEEWKLLKDKVEQLFKMRNTKEVTEPMKQGIALFIQLLHWSNGLPVCLSPIQYEQLTIKPVNVKERLEFILSRPHLYHSFIQLVELMTEMEKQWFKVVAINKAKQ
ncbi:hypothetical protein SM124_16005 [Bacillus sp. 31A1R]|uniref:YpoC-like domain-containing protein n=1 Tax=Robertmurraya mangrovi TaxID=3098077 RepID=A0ABU5J1I0_9BACI|nr:hypothetical protein [Bacillus sp. 31A1R]